MGLTRCNREKDARPYTAPAANDHQAVRGTGCRTAIARRKHHQLSREQPQPAHQTRPARNLPKFCVYPLGIMRKRSYDGGLSFLAQMQIGVEDGV